MPLTVVEAAKLRTPGRSNPITPLRPVPKAPTKPPPSPMQQQRRIPKAPPGKR